MKEKTKVIIIILLFFTFLISGAIIFRYPILGWILSKQMSKKNIPGLSITVIEENNLKWTKSFGEIKNASNVSVTEDTLFQAASVTKLFVSVLALHFVEKGKIDLDKDVNIYLKSWKIPDNEFTIENKVTLRMLLSHRSGLPETNLSYQQGELPSLIQVLNGKLPAQNKPASVEIIPGSQWRYSNIAFAVIQLLIEEVSGQSIGMLMDDVIFKPLQMKNSTLVYPLTNEFSERQEAMPHDDNGISYAADLHPTAYAQGGLLSTSSDVAKFLIELMRTYNGESELIISKTTIKNMFHDEIELDPNVFGGIPVSQGLGVFIIKGDPFYILSVGDNVPGANCWVVGIPQLGKGAVVMTNGRQGFDLSPKIIGVLLIMNRWPMPNL